jgi:hypothetical protein
MATMANQEPWGPYDRRGGCDEEQSHDRALGDDHVCSSVAPTVGEFCRQGLSTVRTRRTLWWILNQTDVCAALARQVNDATMHPNADSGAIRPALSSTRAPARQPA